MCVCFNFNFFFHKWIKQFENHGEWSSFIGNVLVRVKEAFLPSFVLT